MNYQDVLNDLFDICERHKMIKTVGYGPLSDLVNPKDKDERDYPYAYFNPTAHTLSKGQITFRFNLIVMEICEEDVDSTLKGQSDALQYIKDILAELYYNYDQKYDFTLNSVVTPFKEKYNDTVSGMTAQIDITIPDILNDCIAPFEPK